MPLQRTRSALQSHIKPPGGPLVAWALALIPALMATAIVGCGANTAPVHAPAPSSDGFVIGTPDAGAKATDLGLDIPPQTEVTAPAPDISTNLGDTDLGDTLPADTLPADALPADTAPPPDIAPPDPGPVFWSKRAPLPEPRRHPGLVTHGGSLYVVGGAPAQDAPAQADPAPILQNNLSSDTWVAGGAMITPRHLHGLAVLGGLVYAIAGRQTQPNGVQTLSSVERFNPGTNAWKSAFSLPGAGCCVAAIADGERLWVFGGRNGSAAVQSFKPETGLWVDHAAMPVGRSRHAAARVAKTVLIAGGLSGDTPDTATPIHGAQRFNLTTETWSDTPPPPFDVRWDLAMAAWEGRFWIIGGRDQTGTATSTVYLYDLEAGWATAPTLPSPRAEHAAVGTPSGLIVLGGNTSPSSSPSSSTAVDVLTL